MPATPSERLGSLRLLSATRAFWASIVVIVGLTTMQLMAFASTGDSRHLSVAALAILALVVGQISGRDTHVRASIVLAVLLGITHLLARSLL